MTLLKIHLGMIGITVNNMAISVIQYNLSVTTAIDNTGNGNSPLPNAPLKSTDTQNEKAIKKRLIIQPAKPVCRELKQMVTDASIHAANLSMKELYKVFMYGNYHFN